jgi:trimethylamine--corrinoid protein Co-methyltransferase
VAFKYSILNMKKPFISCPINAQQMADVYDMAEVIAGGYDKLRQAPFVIAAAEPVAPLGLMKDATEILLLAARRDLPLVWYPMASAGTTAPCSGAGVLALSNAECLAGLVLHQLARRGAPFIYGMMPGMTDLRAATQWAYGSPDLALLTAAATDLAHSYGLPMYGTAGCSDAWMVDQQAVAEATIHCVLSQLSGANLVHDVGILAGAVAVSPEMMVLCNEVLDMIEHATQQVDTRPEDLAVDLVDEVGPRGDYLAADHTLANFRRFWYPRVFQRVRLAVGATEEPESITARINRRTLEIIEQQDVEPLPADTLHELDEMEKGWLARIV